MDKKTLQDFFNENYPDKSAKFIKIDVKDKNLVGNALFVKDYVITNDSYLRRTIRGGYC
jgi:uncharacterized ubiquitin-like protein YukD